MSQPTFKRKHQADYIFLFLLFILVVFGLVVLSSASVAVAQKFNDTNYFLKRQILFGVLPGLGFAFVTSWIDYRAWKKLAWPVFILSIILLIAVFIPHVGVALKGARRWIGFPGFLFQTSEAAKLAIIIFLSYFLEKKIFYGKQEVISGNSAIPRRITSIEEENLETGGIDWLPILGYFIVIAAVVAGLVIMQPDLGTALVILAISVSIYFAARAPLKHFAVLIIMGVAAVMMLIKMTPYRVERLETFMHPELDPQGQGYQTNQAFLAIGSGGLWGRGLGHSRQKFQYLPEVTGDSIFAVMAEELGLFRLSLYLIVLFLFFRQGFKIAKKAPDFFGRLLVIGVMFWVISQSFLNIAAMAGLAPLTGVPLPFVSYGASAMVILLGAIGIVVNVSKQTRKT